MLAPQAVHEVDALAALETNPAEQETHAVASTSSTPRLEPAGQGEQVEVPSLAAKYPAAQSVQALWSAFCSLPAGQVLQAVPSETNPGAQASQ